MLAHQPTRTPWHVGRWSSAALLVAALLGLPSSAAAKTLYVNGSTGNDATSYDANSASSPWRTIGRAAWGSTNRGAPNANEAARAGDVVQVAAGTYTTVGGGDRWDVAYNPVNNGTGTAPIRFEGTGTVNLTFSSGDGPVIGANVRNYIYWSGFTINESSSPSQPDTAPVVFFGATGGGIENSVLIGNPNWTYRVGDNYSGVRVHASRGQRIVNNQITGYGGQTGDENHAGITTYWVGDLTIQNNDISNCGAGIYLKGNNTSAPVSGYFVVRFNLFRNNVEGMRVLLIPSTSSSPNVISQNIFVQNRVGLLLTNNENGPSAPRWARIVNNTFINNQQSGFSFQGTHVADASHAFWNNIVVGGTYAIDHTSFQSSAQLSPGQIGYEHNLYFGFTAAHSSIISSRYTLATWRSTFGKDGAAPAAIEANPAFVNQAGGDYRLAAGSPARGLGRAIHGVGGADGSAVAAGAYITGTEVIGRTSGTIPLPNYQTPSAPTNLRVITN